ncbi:NADPH quinone reductase MdaB [Campylobacter ornithocola]|uniref:NADPH quinone reductase MdaB n=1 Tax=Campylobacter ornithocola TaxID=1848766 RepID=A0A6M8MHY0_9BACT|nr:NAD(P)H-dependent oxidoreductase [Campylobacter ornithocola]OCX43189.1 NADPH quinone reductase MdaB [Campylobacter ornithocola]QKF56905.1 flavodoxin-like fold domain-containing protein, putative NAD(P)H (quinone) dehydrogenase/reductase [Campylobacter ornithocola]
MKKILLLNGAKDFGHSKGRLNTSLHEVALKTLQELGLQTQQTHIDQGYIIEDEVEKILNADVLIWQMPGWWMGEPWIVKKYIDDVFTAGHGKLYTSDGRSRNDVNKKYGSGGLLQDKKYMLSLTWNAPIQAFTDKEQFFEGVGVDGVYLHLHKANQFLGMKALPTFICNDVIKNPQVQEYFTNYKTHLEKIFKA